MEEGDGLRIKNEEIICKDAMETKWRRIVLRKVEKECEERAKLWNGRLPYVAQSVKYERLYF